MMLEVLTDEEKSLFAEICKLTEYQTGQQIISEEDKGDSLLLIRKGRVEVRKILDSDNYKHLKELDTGEFFGEMSFLNRDPRSASIVALENCEILELTRADFDVLAESNPVLGLKIYMCIAEELASRLKRNNEDLKKAILWAIEGADLC